MHALTDVLAIFDVVREAEIAHQLQRGFLVRPLGGFEQGQVLPAADQVAVLRLRAPKVQEALQILLEARLAYASAFPA